MVLVHSPQVHSHLFPVTSPDTRSKCKMGGGREGNGEGKDEKEGGRKREGRGRKVVAGI